jgi:hypothetical protein
MQSKLNFAQQYGTIQQGSISDIETAQNGLNTLENCWLSAAGNSNLTDAQRTQAATTADSASSTLIALNTQITPYNDSITAVNNEIALLEQLQTQALSVSSVADVQALQANYTSLQTSAPFITQTDLTTAQQNRTTLQAQMASTNQLTQTGLAQCNAMIQGH